MTLAQDVRFLGTMAQPLGYAARVNTARAFRGRWRQYRFWTGAEITEYDPIDPANIAQPDAAYRALHAGGRVHLAFNAHEVLEAAWKSSPDDERPLRQGLAQLAVGITHVQRGNLGGATMLLRRGSGRLGEVDHPAPYSVDVDGLVGWAAALVDELAAGADISPPRLRPALTKP